MEDLIVSEQLTIRGYEMWFTTHRASGPGGQHVNKTESGVTLHWVPSHSGSLDADQRAILVRRLATRLTLDGELQISAQDERSQVRNKQLTYDRLATLVRDALKPRKRRLKTRPSMSAERRRLEEKTRRGAIKRSRSDQPDPHDD